MVDNCDIDVLINGFNLRTCSLKTFHLSKDNIIALQNAKHLEKLVLVNCTVSTIEDDDRSKVDVEVTASNRLQRLKLLNCNFTLNVNASNLICCEMIKVNLSKGNIFQELHFAHELETLTIKMCETNTFSSEANNANNIDLTTCRHLKHIDLSDLNCIVSLCTENLRCLFLSDYDLTKGNIAEAFQNAVLLHTITLKNINNKLGENGDMGNVLLDLKGCMQLRSLEIINCKLGVSINAPN